MAEERQPISTSGGGRSSIEYASNRMSAPFFARHVTDEQDIRLIGKLFRARIAIGAKLTKVVRHKVLNDFVRHSGLGEPIVAGNRVADSDESRRVTYPKPKLLSVVTALSTPP